MGVSCLILGESGTGKSASMRNFKSDEVLLINVANKPLPFRGKFETVATDSYRKIKSAMRETGKKVIVIDDAQYLMANEFMRRATEKGYDKFTEIAQNFWDLMRTVSELPEDVVVYVMAHIERDANGNEKIKTIGKMLDEKITIEGMFTIVLKTNVTDGAYSFLTQNSGHDTVKSPMGLFNGSVIDNDLKAVDNAIRSYYEMTTMVFDDIVPSDDVPFNTPEPTVEARERVPETFDEEYDKEYVEATKKREEIKRKMAEMDANTETPTRKKREYPESPAQESAPTTEESTGRRRRRKAIDISEDVESY